MGYIVYKPVGVGAKKHEIANEIKAKAAHVDKKRRYKRYYVLTALVIYNIIVTYLYFTK